MVLMVNGCVIVEKLDEYGGKQAKGAITALLNQISEKAYTEAIENGYSKERASVLPRSDT